MLPAGGIDELVADPVGRYLSGESFLYFCATPKLYGIVFWGRPRADDLARLVRGLVVELGPRAVPHVSLVDVRRVEAVEPGAFAVLAEYVRVQREPLARRVERLALVRPEGLMGAVAEGFYAMLAPPPYPVETFDEPQRALSWLTPDPPPQLLRELDALVARARGASPLLVALRDLLDARPGALDLAAAARALSVSERTLQRRLRDEATTFQGEHAASQIRVAQRLLLETDAKLAAVAVDVGCATLQHFSALFRRLVGEAPSSWRARERGLRGGERERERER